MFDPTGTSFSLFTSSAHILTSLHMQLRFHGQYYKHSFADSIFISPLVIIAPKIPTLIKSDYLSLSLSPSLHSSPAPVNWICLEENTIVLTGRSVKSWPQTTVWLSCCLLCTFIKFILLSNYFIPSLFSNLPNPILSSRSADCFLIPWKNKIKSLSTNLLTFCPCSHMSCLPFYNNELSPRALLDLTSSHILNYFNSANISFSPALSTFLSTESFSSAFIHVSTLKYLYCPHILL